MDVYKVEVHLYTFSLGPTMCPDLTAPDNGQVVMNGTSPGDTAMYSCNMDFDLEGVDTVTCEDDGVWSAQPPVCIRELSHNLLFWCHVTEGIRLIYIPVLGFQ